MLMIVVGFNLSPHYDHYESTKVHWDPKWDRILVLEAARLFYTRLHLSMQQARTVLQTIPG